MIAIQGKKRDYHFRHSVDSLCSGGLETALHKLAKQIIVDSKEMVLPLYGKIPYENAISEKGLQTFIPDVSAKLLDGSNIYFEIFHRHKNSLSKEFFYQSSKLKSVEIDMCKCPLNSIDSIRNYVLKGTKNKKIIYWEDKEISFSTQKVNEFKWLNMIAFMGLVLAIFAYFSLNKKNKT